MKTMYVLMTLDGDNKPKIVNSFFTEAAAIAARMEYGTEAWKYFIRKKTA